MNNLSVIGLSKPIEEKYAWLREIYPTIEDTLGRRYPNGTLASAEIGAIYLEGESIQALIDALREGLIDLALIPDDRGLEEEAKFWQLNEELNYAQSSSGDDEWEKDVRRRIRQERPKRIERCLGLKIEDPPVLRALVKKEDKDQMWTSIFGGIASDVIFSELDEVAVTPYPTLLLAYFDKRLGNILSERGVKCVENPERFMREVKSPKAKLAYELMRTGATAKKYGLVPIDQSIPAGLYKEPRDPTYRCYPSFWRRKKPVSEAQGKAVSELVEKLAERLATVIGIERKSAKDIFGRQNKNPFCEE